MLSSGPSSSLPIFELVPDALVLVDGSGVIVKANRNAHALFGYGAGELVGKPVEQLVPRDARERHKVHRAGYMRAPRMRAMAGGETLLVGQRCDGRQFPVEIALSPLDLPEGRHFLASVRDISETRRVRQSLRRAGYDAVVARIGQMALASDGGASLVSGIPRMLARVLGMSDVAIVVVEAGEPVVLAATGSIGAGLPGWLSATTGPLNHALAGRTTLLDATSTADWGGARAGAIVPLVDQGKPAGALVAVSPMVVEMDHDVVQLLETVANLLSALVQRRHFEEELAHAQRLDAVGQLTGGIAHDFNNLLTVVSGHLQLLEEECGDRPDSAEILGGARRAVERGAELTRKLLAFARRQHLAPRALDPVDVLRGLEDLLRHTFDERTVLQFHRPEASAPVSADPYQLDNALLNLALNARDAMPGGGTITVAAAERWITLDRTRPSRIPGHYIAFSVADGGQGMDSEVLAHACEPFFTTKAPGRGSGLGLSMVYGFVRQSGGFMEIDSRPGEGTRVEMFLPAATGDRDDDELERDTAWAAGSGPARANVLVVDDEADVRAAATRCLRAMGHRVVAVGAATEALNLLEDPSKQFDVLFTDYCLGSGANGRELAQAARGLRPGLGVLLTSGRALAPTDRAGLEILPKPYRREQLEVAIRRALRG